MARPVNKLRVHHLLRKFAKNTVDDYVTEIQDEILPLPISCVFFSIRRKCSLSLQGHRQLLGRKKYDHGKIEMGHKVG